MCDAMRHQKHLAKAGERRAASIGMKPTRNQLSCPVGAHTVAPPMSGLLCSPPVEDTFEWNPGTSIKRVFGGMNTAVPHANPIPGSDGESGEEAEAIGEW
jgi:hypothetical protein